jgi:uncharacterized protein YPO0396
MVHLMADLDGERREGFRLQRLEVYNWGTFNRQVWVVEPEGSTALLTGANGSGKSTLVDALLTLLVPNIKRNYNQASGSDRRRERDEKSYVRGAYGRIKDDASNRGIVQYLRGKDSYAALLAHFRNERSAQDVSVAQLFYWREDELKKLYVIAPLRLSIAEHLQITSTPDEVRKRLKALGAEVVEEFSRYSRELIKRLRLRSSKALDLFNQTVSIKEIGGLNDFVRRHMLERTESSEKIARLRETYQNLTRAHDAIVRAEAQLERLEPLLQEAEQYQQLMVRIGEAERCAEAIPFFFARRTIALIDQAVADAQVRIDEGRQQAHGLKVQVEALRSQEIHLNVAISNDTVGQQLQRIEQELGYARERYDEKHGRAGKYNAIANKLKFPVYADQQTFFTTAQQAREAVPQIEQRLQKLIRERDEQKQAEGRLIAVCRELGDELASLRSRKSRIPSHDLRIRSALAEALELDEDELPFIGELLKVRDAASAWEGAIERLLGGYGRQMLVPETHYPQVLGYVDATNLRGRLIYHRADPHRMPRSSADLDPDALFHKLEIKPSAALHDWLKADLLDDWEFICCATSAQFQRERRALTINGQIKRGGARHEKDDRYNLNDRTRYVLGWDNRDKIAALEVELARENTALEATRQALAKINTEQQQWNTRLQQLRELLAFDDFNAIDWQVEAQRVAELEHQQQELQAGSDQLARLQEQLSGVRERLTLVDHDLQTVQADMTTLERDIERFERRRGSYAARIAAAPPGLLAGVTARIEADLKGRSLSLEMVDEQQSQMERYYNQSASSLRGQTNALERGMIEKMVRFKSDYPEDTADIDSGVEAIEEYRRMHERISRDDLPTHRRRFKEWLDGKVLDAIVGFKSSLDKQVAEYRESIATLNGALSTIDYTGSTYIQLTTEPNRDREVDDFRNTLRACIPDVGQRTPEANEASFQRIRALIDRFDKEERWTAKVTDVRNWLDFAAEERYRENSEVKHYYSDSSGKSGGQKAKLAYTILASAIAYQYGLSDEQQRSFRFVVVDEAFSKSDETNARYAMDLFRQLHLQLLVVTPLDKTHVVEPYIAACHFVSNTPEENDSRVITMTIDEYHTEKAAFAQIARVER